MNNDHRVMAAPLFWLCWLVSLLLDWIPGYCRYYTVPGPPNPGAEWMPRFADLKAHWEWRWRADWGFRLLAKLGLIDDFADEAQRRFDERNPSSGS